MPIQSWSGQGAAPLPSGGTGRLSRWTAQTAPVDAVPLSQQSFSLGNTEYNNIDHFTAQFDKMPKAQKVALYNSLGSSAGKDQLAKAIYDHLNSAGRSQAPAKENGWQQAGDVLKGVWDNTGGAVINTTGNLLGDVYSLGKTALDQNSTSNTITAGQAQIKYINQLESQGKLSHGAASLQRNAIMQKINDSSSNANKSVQNSNQIKRGQMASDAAETFLNLATAGVGGALLKGGELAGKTAVDTGLSIARQSAAKKIAQDVALKGTEGALVGGGYGALETARNPNATPIDYLRNAGTAAVTGAALAGTGTAIGKGIQTVLSRGAQARLEQLHSTPVSPDLTPEQVKSFTPQNIRVDGNPDSGTGIGVKTPLKVGVKDVSNTSNVEVKTAPKMTPQEYATEFNKISKSYDQSTKFLHTMSPMKQQVMQAAIDARHQTMLQKLDEAYHNPQISESPSKVTRIEQKTTQAPKNTGGAPKGYVNTTGEGTAKLKGKSTSTAPATVKVSGMDNVRTGATKPLAPSKGDPVVSVKRADGTTEQYKPKTQAELDKYTKTIDEARKQNGDTTNGVAGVPDKNGDVWHISDGSQVKANYKTMASAPKPAFSTGDKTSGGATKAEQRAITNELATHFDNKATYSGRSYKDETAKATQLVHDNPQKAMDIAMGRTSGDNPVHEVAIAKAVEQKALKEGDINTLQQLALSDRHTKTSEAAQRLGAEGYKMDSYSPVDVMKKIINDRRAAVDKSTGSVTKAVAKETSNIKTKVKAPTKQDWSLFVESIKC